MKMEFAQCSCGKMAKKQIGNVSSNLDSYKLKIYNIPYYKCSKCKEMVFEPEVKLASIIAWAYQSKIGDVIWSKSLIKQFEN